MIQPISYNSLNFKGELKIKTPNGEATMRTPEGGLSIKTPEGEYSKALDDFLETIILGEEEREIFKEELDSFQKSVEGATSDETKLILTLKEGKYDPGINGGKGIVLDIRDTEREGVLHRSIHPTVRPNGSDWNVGEKFRYELKKVLNKLGKTAVSSRNLFEARERNHRSYYA